MLFNLKTYFKGLETPQTILNNKYHISDSDTFRLHNNIFYWSQESISKLLKIEKKCPKFDYTFSLLGPRLLHILTRYLYFFNGGNPSELPLFDHLRTVFQFQFIIIITIHIDGALPK